MPCIDTVRGFYFCHAPIQPRTSVYSVFCIVNAVYTANAAKQCTELCRGFSCDCTRSTAHDTKPTQAAIIPPAPRWSVSQRRSTSSTYQIPDATPDAVQLSTAAYYNNVYKGRPCYGSMPDSAAYRRPCQPGGVISYRVWIAGKCCTQCTY